MLLAMKFKKYTYFQLLKYRLRQLVGETNTAVYSSIGFHYYRCIFFHIPKTAGVAISQSLFGSLGLGHINVGEAKQRFSGPEFNDYFKFTIVRNPYSRAYSAFYFLKNGGFTSRDEAWALENFAGIDDFQSFVHDWLTPDHCELMTHFLPQYRFVTCLDTGRIELDFIGRYERLDKDFMTIKKNIKNRQKLKVKNITPSRSPLVLTGEMRDIIYDCYAKDFELFNYSK